MLDSHYFHYTDNSLCCEKVRLEELADTFGTPLYVTSSTCLTDNYTAFERAFEALPHFTCYSVKANFNLEVIRTQYSWDHLVDEHEKYFQWMLAQKR